MYLHMMDKRYIYLYFETNSISATASIYALYCAHGYEKHSFGLSVNANSEIYCVHLHALLQTAILCNTLHVYMYM